MSTVQRLSPTVRIRHCDRCGKEEQTTTKLSSIKRETNTDFCSDCTAEVRNEEAIAIDIKRLTEFGYNNVTLTDELSSGKRVYSVAPKCCGREQHIRFGNAQTAFNNGQLQCKFCGVQRRVEKAIIAGQELQAAKIVTVEQSMSEYRQRVEGFARQTMNIHNDALRAMFVGEYFKMVMGYKVSISDCFDKQIPAEVAGCLVNMLPRHAHTTVAVCLPIRLNLKEWVGIDLSQVDTVTQMMAGLDTK